MNEYQKKAINFLEKTNVHFSSEYLCHGFYFPEDKDVRAIYQITLQRDNIKQVFKFGQSLKESYNIRKEKIIKLIKPYEFLSCLTTYLPGTFEDFCSDYGYDTDSRKALELYLAV